MFTNYDPPHFAVCPNLMLLPRFWPTNSFMLFVNSAFGAITLLNNQVKLASYVISLHLRKLFNFHIGYVNMIRLVYAYACLWCNSLHRTLPLLF